MRFIIELEDRKITLELRDSTSVPDILKYSMSVGLVPRKWYTEE